MGNMKIYLGIDPGKNGAIAALVDDEWIWHRWDENFAHIVDWMDSVRLRGDIFCAIEKQHTRPVMKDGKMIRGVKSSGAIMENYGMWKGMLEAFRIPRIYVQPQTWQKACLDSGPAGTTKQRSLNMVSQLYSINLKKSEDGIADAINIARYAKQYKAV